MNTNLTGAGPHVILCPDAFSKCRYLANLAQASERPVIYLDMDMMYSGYLQAGIMQKAPHILVRRPDRSSWRREMSGIIDMVSMAPHLTIIDTLNGLGLMLGGPEGGRLAAHSTMFLSALGGDAGTSVVAAAVARNGADGWEMAPGGRLVLGEHYILKGKGITPLTRQQG